MWTQSFLTRSPTMAEQQIHSTSFPLGQLKLWKHVRQKNTEGKCRWWKTTWSHSSFFFTPSVAALKQELVTQLMSQEPIEQTKQSTGARLLRATSLRTPIDSRARVMAHNGSDKNSTHTEDQAQDLGSGDTGFFDSPDDYGETETSRPDRGHMVLPHLSCLGAPYNSKYVLGNSGPYKIIIDYLISTANEDWSIINR